MRSRSSAPLLVFGALVVCALSMAALEGAMSAGNYARTVARSAR